MKFKKILFGLPVLAPIAILASCANVNSSQSEESAKSSNPAKTTPVDQTKEDKNGSHSDESGKSSNPAETTPVVQTKEVKFATSQGKYWPLIFALDSLGQHKNGLIPYYNEKFKNDPDFVPVRLQLQDETKTKTQQDTADNLETAFSTKSKDFPALVLGDVTSAIVANRNNRLLDLSSLSSKLNPSLFNQEVVNNYNKLNLSNNKLFNIPFNVNDVDATSFNLDNMAIIFDLIKQGGGTVDENMELYKKAMESKNKGNSVPANSLFKAIQPKSNTVFKNMHINQSTFTTIESALEFANNFVAGIQIDSSKTSILNDETANISIFDIDYAHQSLVKDVISNTGKGLWDITDKTGTPSFEFPIDTDASLQDKFKSVYDKFTSKINTIKTQVNGKDKIIQAIQYKNYKKPGGFGEWGSHDILLYHTAFGYVPGVGIKQSIDTATSRSLFPDQIANFATYQDVYTIGQALKATPDAPYSAYWSGGSSIIPIKTDDEKINKGAVKFLEWLYTGTNDITGKTMSNLDYIAEVGAYFVPTKDYITQTKLDELTKERDGILAQIQEAEKTTGKTFEKQGDAAKDIQWNLYAKLANLNSVILSMKSMLEALKHTNDGQTKFLYDSSDPKAGKISKTIGDSLIERTNFEKPTTKTSDGILDTIKGIVESN
ncbi:P68 family surface lipoprotein [Mesomycoplasma bovoculi]|uniref:Lipoprotein B-1 n=1 Tax=Mesomycoplasma bovoculi M165/69 TaxID=743966 RepID=W5V0V1_9BACT|nr:hypothetical protein [Mesomycoplasma bovoculi]AHH45393.1 Lipoprotein B-1 [Mesomycoplasma bovoculi M165/69]